MKANNYFLKPGYRSRLVAETVEGAPGEYWTPWRIQAASVYQWYVYELAARIARTMPKKPHVLDVGAGYPIKLRLVADAAASVTVVDQVTTGGRIATDFPDFRFVGMDLEAPCDALDRRFDLIVCSDVVEHLLDPDPCIGFVRRQLAPGGVAVFSTPERDILRGPECMASPKAEHVREWNRQEFVRYLESHGFHTEQVLLLPPARLTPEQAQACRSEAHAARPECSACLTLIVRDAAG